MSERTPEPATVLLRRGEVHSPADPYATAMVVERGQVAWVGSEGAADSFADGVDSTTVVRVDTPARVRRRARSSSSSCGVETRTFRM